MVEFAPYISAFGQSQTRKYLRNTLVFKMKTVTENVFDWVPFYGELANKLVPFRSQQARLIAFLQELRAEGVKTTPIEDQDETGARFTLTEIDPFTFFGSFNRGTTSEMRIRILTAAKTRFAVNADVPSHFGGIPILNNQNSWFFSYQPKRKPGDIEKLWEVFVRALDSEALESEEFAHAFDEALKVRGTNLNLTVALFWLRPSVFLNLDSTNRDYLHIKLPKEGLTFAFYKTTLERIRQTKNADFLRLSSDAFETGKSGASATGTTKEPISTDIEYWMVGASWSEGDQTERFLSEGVWENGYEDRYLDDVRAMKVGDRIAIKAATTQKKNLPFEYEGRTASLLRIKATGTIVANLGDGRAVEVEWDTPLNPPRDWYFYTQRSTVWHLRKDNEFAQALIRFVFEGQQQDYSFFISKTWDEGDLESEIALTDSVRPYAVADLVSDGVFLTEVEIDRALRLLRIKKNLILQGAPGVGKTFLAKRLGYALMEAKDDSRITVVQFHPSFTYEDFVRGYRPTAEAGKFALQKGPFLRICERADKDLDRNYVLVIDEVNRGNISQIFGELMMLLEADKRGKEHALTPLYRENDDESLHVPANLYVIATMNIADRSLALVDYALRRRFAYLTLEPQFDSGIYREWLRNRGMPETLIQRIVTRMKSLNTRIAEEPQLGDAFRIGHSFFCPLGKDFSGLNEAWYKDVITTEIKPLLEEYWYDDRDKARLACEELLG